MFKFDISQIVTTVYSTALERKQSFVLERTPVLLVTGRGTIHQPGLVSFKAARLERRVAIANSGASGTPSK